jgi:hypothetical protein
MDTSEHSHTPVTIGPRRTSLVQIAGSLGIASTMIAMAVFLVALFGFSAVFILAPLAVAMGALGFILSIVGGVMRPYAGTEETQPVAALFVSLMGIVFAAVEMMLRP